MFKTLRKNIPLSIPTRIKFYRGLKSTLNSGRTLSEYLRDARSRAKGKFAEDIQTLQNSIEKGATLGDAAQQTPSLFSSYSPSLIRAGEKAGVLPAVLDDLITDLEEQRQLYRTLIFVFIYPALLILAWVVFFSAMEVAFAWTSAQLEYKPLSYPSLILTYLKSCLLKLFWIAKLALFSWGSVKLAAYILGPIKIQTTLKTIPLIGRAMRLRSRARLSKILSVALGAGLNIDESIHLACKATGDFKLSQKGRLAADHIRKGATFAESADSSELFESEFIGSIESGEKSGTLSETFATLAKEAREELSELYKIISTYTFYAMMFILGVFMIFFLIRSYNHLYGTLLFNAIDSIK